MTLCSLVQFIVTIKSINLFTQCEIWVCSDEHRADILSCIAERQTHSSSSTALSLSIFYSSQDWKAHLTQKCHGKWKQCHNSFVWQGGGGGVAPWQQLANNFPKFDHQNLALNHTFVSVQFDPPAPAKSCPWRLKRNKMRSSPQECSLIILHIFQFLGEWEHQGFHSGASF